MAEMHPASAANAEISPAHGSILITLQHDVGTIKQEIKDLRTMVESLIKEIKDVKRVKVETVGDPFPLSFPSVRHYIPVFASGVFVFFTRITPSILLAIVTSFSDHRFHPPVYVMRTACKLTRSAPFPDVDLES